MYSVKQIFLILSILSVATAKKGVSIRGPSEETMDARRGLKKSSSKKSGGGGVSGGSFIPPRQTDGSPVGGSVPTGDGVNRDGTVTGQLIEPAGKACVPFDEASRWLTPDYPGDEKCRGQGIGMGNSAACCRVFSFADAGGSQKWLLFDANNQYRDLMCVCNENTRTGTDPTTPAIPVVPVPAAPAASPVTAPVAAPVAAPVIPAATGQALCDFPNPTQLDLQGRPGVTACKSNAECGGNGAAKCCSVKTCICYPANFMQGDECIPAP